MPKIIDKYGSQWNAPPLPIQVEFLMMMQPDEVLKKAGVSKPDIYKNAAKTIWPHLDWHRWMELCNNEIRRPEAKVTVIMGAGCVAGHTRILNPLTGEQPTIKELYESQTAPIVMTLHGAAQAGIPFIKGVEDLYEVVLENGSKFTVTQEHRILTARGFLHVADLLANDCLFSYEVQSRGQDAISHLETIEDLTDCCCFSFHPNGELLRYAREACQVSPPSQDDALKHNLKHSGSGDLDCKLKHNLSLSQAFPPSIGGSAPPCDFLGNRESRHLPEEIFLCAAPSIRCGVQSHLETRRNYSFEKQVPDFSDKHYQDEFFCNQKLISLRFNITQSKIVSITETHKDIFYDISVPGVEHYFAEGAIHHNSTGKTCVSGWEYLLEYYASPDDTLVLISSTDLSSLEGRVWGELKMLHEMAVQKFPWLPGYLLDSKHCITTDRLEKDEYEEESKTRDLRKGVMCVPTIQGNKNVGLGKWIGRKQKHMRLIADDCTAMSATFLSAFANLNNNIDFQAIILGNPSDILDPLGIASEPLDGWSGHLEPTKTTVWDTRFFNGRCINLVGTDSPNFDFPENQPEKYPYLVSRKKINETMSAFAKDSYEYFSQCVGVMKISQLARRVITKDLCRQFHVKDKAILSGEKRTVIAALDASYGGDRCVGGHAEYGKCIDDVIRLQFYPHHIVPVATQSGEPMVSEDSISKFEKKYCESNQIPPENFFHDSTGRGSLGTSLSRTWSSLCNPVEFGGAATKRPVTMDTFVIDKETGRKRLKRCEEAYSKFVTELYWSLRLAIEADQIRGLPEDVIEEMCMREWDRVSGDRIEVESKILMKVRTRKSPDLADWAVIILEGARRRGFQISKMSNKDESQSDSNRWLSDLSKKRFEWHKSKMISVR